MLVGARLMLAPIGRSLRRAPLRLRTLELLTTLVTVQASALSGVSNMSDPKSLSNEEWRKKLTPEQFHVSFAAPVKRIFGTRTNCGSSNIV